MPFLFLDRTAALIVAIALSAQAMFTAYMNGTPAEVPEAYAGSSPITYADRVRAPLLVIHGRDDIRCPPGQMQRYLDRLSVRGADVEVEWFTAGHLGGVANPTLQREFTERMLNFAERSTG